MEDFDDWYFEEHGRVLGACAALSGNLDAAREATDEAFTRALEHWDKVTAMASPGAWVQTVALNCFRRTARRRRLEHLGRTTTDETAPAPGLPDAELWAAVRALPVRQQTAVVLRYVGDQPEAAIAEAMGVTRGTVASTLADARARLRTALGTEIDDEETVHG